MDEQNMTRVTCTSDSCPCTFLVGLLSLPGDSQPATRKLLEKSMEHWLLPSTDDASAGQAAATDAEAITAGLAFPPAPPPPPATHSPTIIDAHHIDATEVASEPEEFRTALTSHITNGTMEVTQPDLGFGGRRLQQLSLQKWLFGGKRDVEPMDAMEDSAVEVGVGESPGDDYGENVEEADEGLEIAEEAEGMTEKGAEPVAIAALDASEGMTEPSR